MAFFFLPVSVDLVRLIGSPGTSHRVVVRPSRHWESSMLSVKYSGAKATLLGICYFLGKARCLVPPNSVFVIFNKPFFGELVAPRCLMYLC